MEAYLNTDGLSEKEDKFMQISKRKSVDMWIMNNSLQFQGFYNDLDA